MSFAFIFFKQSAQLGLLDYTAESFVADIVSTMNLAITFLEYVVMVVRKDIWGSDVINVRCTCDMFDIRIFSIYLNILFLQ